MELKCANEIFGLYSSISTLNDKVTKYMDEEKIDQNDEDNINKKLIELMDSAVDLGHLIEKIGE